MKLERLYGIRNGGNRKSAGIRMNNVLSDKEHPHTQEELAANLGIDVKTLRNAKRLVSLPSEIQDLVEVGNISPSTLFKLF